MKKASTFKYLLSWPFKYGEYYAIVKVYNLTLIILELVFDLET